MDENGNQDYQAPKQEPQEPYRNYQNPMQGGGPAPYNGKVPGQSNATASMVLGILAVVFWFFGYSSLLSIVLGIIGLVLASNSKQAGFSGNTRTAGFVLSLIGLIGGAIAFIACVGCVGCIASMGAAGSHHAY